MTLSTLYDMARDIGYSDQVIVYAISLSRNVVGYHNRTKERYLFVSSLWLSAKEHDENKIITARKLFKIFEVNNKMFYRYMVQIRNRKVYKSQRHKLIV